MLGGRQASSIRSMGLLLSQRLNQTLAKPMKFVMSQIRPEAIIENKQRSTPI
jgi:hypothetical protein